MNWLTNKFIQSLILKGARSGAMAIGGYLIAHGYLTSTVGGQVEGSLICLAGAGFSAFDAYVVKRKLQVTAATGSVPATVNMLQPAPQASMKPIPDTPGET